VPPPSTTGLTKKPVLVDEVQLDEVGGQASTADGQVISWLPLQLDDLVSYAAPDQPGVPLDLLEGL
jgi:hypothetical protein